MQDSSTEEDLGPCGAVGQPVVGTRARSAAEVVCDLFSPSSEALRKVMRESGRSTSTLKPRALRAQPTSVLGMSKPLSTLPET